MKKQKGNAIILVSGGMDSCVTAAQAIKDSYKPFFLHVNYGQRTKRREKQAFNDIANFYNIKEKVHVGTYSTIPTRTGLGTSSAMVVGLINCIKKYKNLKLSNKKIVKDAYTIERKICKQYGGWQDQIVSQYGSVLDIKIIVKCLIIFNSILHIFRMPEV